MEPPIASPTATKLVLHRKSLRLGACAFIGFLPHKALSLIRINVAMLGRAVRTL
jgi:hypothetical protein